MIQLNEVQRAAVAAPEGPALVLAGAGSGKTRVIIERMAHLVEEFGVAPRQLLALTFTNKAAAEMRRRFTQRVGLEHAPAWLGTFHSFGLWVLRREAEVIGRPRNFSIYDDTDQLSLMKRLVKELPGHFEAVTPRDALGFISRVKQVDPHPVWDEAPETPEEETCRELWTRYHETLKQCGAFDFDDLTSLTAYLFEQHPEACDRYRRRFRHVLIDEYQDTNRSQYIIARSLGEESSLFVVGDEDQSIYSWRGADINNILDFVKDFPRAKAYRLEQNYRSVQTILDAANAVVANNRNRLGKTLFTEQKGGDPVRFFFAEDGREEAEFVVQDMLRRKLSPGAVAVFYRTHTLARQIEEALRERNIPYAIVGGIKFYSRKEIKDILAYLRLAVNPADDESLRRILNVPPRGIGAAGRAQIEEYAAMRRMPLLQTLRECELDETLSSRVRSSAAELVDIIDTLTSDAASALVAELTETLLDRIKYREYVEQSDEKESRNRIEVVNEFVVACEQYDKRAETGLAAFLEELALVSDVDDWEDDAEAVTLMTCHSAKGLEFPHAYIVGLEENGFPLARFEDGDDLEEERRLCYVAMTRAEKSLTMTAAESRVIYGTSDYGRRPSRFLDEVGEERLVRVDYDGQPKNRKPSSTKSAPVSSRPPEKAEVHAFSKGVSVRHAKFGLGVVLYTRGVGEKMKVHVFFNSGRAATFVASQAPLEVVD